MTKFHRGELETLEDYSEWFGVSANASYEEIDRVYNDYCEEHRRNGGFIRLREGGRLFSDNPFNYPQHPITIVYKILKSKKKCSGCDKFMRGGDFCSQQCLELHQIKKSAFQQITTQLQQKGINTVGDLGENLIEMLDLFPSSCQCEHPWTYNLHIQNCLTTKEQVENFRNRYLNIVERIPSRPAQQANPTTSFSNLGNNSSSSSTGSTVSSNNYDNYTLPNSYSNSPSDSDTYTSTADSSFSDTPTTSEAESNSTSTSSPTTSNSPSKGVDKPNTTSSSTPLVVASPASSPSPKTSNEKPSISNSPVPASQPVKEKSNSSTNQEDLLTKKKQQTIQEIEAMQNLAALTAYQKSLLKKLEEEKNQQLQQQSNTVDSVRNEEGSVVPWIVIGGMVLGGIVFLIFHFRTKQRNSNR